MWSVPIALPFVEADFGSTRGKASLPYTLVMTDFALGGIAMGRLWDRFGLAVAMAMPQVQIVAYCGDLGYGPARGAEILLAMLGFGIVSRSISRQRRWASASASR